MSCVTLQCRLTCTSVQYPHHPGEGVPLILIVKLVTSFLIQLRCIATSYDFVPSQITGWIDDAPWQSCFISRYTQTSCDLCLPSCSSCSFLLCVLTNRCFCSPFSPVCPFVMMYDFFWCKLMILNRNRKTMKKNNFISLPPLFYHGFLQWIYQKRRNCLVWQTNTNGLALCDCTNANKISFCRARAVEKVQDVWESHRQC